jgi:RluA family pseudouridine synthase
MKRFDVPSGWNGSRLDRFVRAHLPGTPFGVVQILLRKGLIYLNGGHASGGTRLKSGDIVSIDMLETDRTPPASATAQEKRKRRKPAMKGPPSEKPEANRRRLHTAGAPIIGEDIPVLYEDDDVLVVDKPPGILVQPGNLSERGSLLDSLEAYRRGASRQKRPRRTATARQDRGASGEPPFPYTPVHRLDRETSGVLIVAKTRPAARVLSRSFAQRTVRKIYLAVVEGVPRKRDGTIGSALATRKDKRSRSEPSPAGQEARTHYSVIRTLRGARALVQLAIETGRTHQIRAHLASIGHPVAGDIEYGAAGSGRGGRFLLHAWMVYFPHPSTGEMLLCTAPPPDDIPVT